MQQTQYNGIERELKGINDKLSILISLLKPLKNISEDIEMSKVSLSKMLKKDNSPSIHVPQPKVMS